MQKLNSIIRPIHRYISLAMSWKNNGLDYVSSVIFRNSWLDRYICVLDSYESNFTSNLVTSIYGWLATKVIPFRDLKFDLGVTGVKKGQILKLFQLLYITRYCYEIWVHELSRHSPQKLSDEKIIWGHMGSQGSN